MVEAFGRQGDAGCQWRVDDLPKGNAQAAAEQMRASIAGWRHINMFAREEQHASEHASDRLGKTVRRVLGAGARKWKAAVPSRPTAYRPRGKAVNDLNGHEAGGGDEQEDQQAIVGAAALRDRYDR